MAHYVSSFSELEQEFIERAHKMVWCNVATINRQNRVRSRILHPIWHGGAGWVVTRRHSHKSKHLAHNPYASLAYVADIARPVYADCLAEWVDDPATKVWLWELFKATPPPLGHDPGLIFETVDHPGYGVLKFTPWRVEVYNPPPGSRIWLGR